MVLLAADYYDKIILSAHLGSSYPLTCAFLSVSGVCEMRGDTALLYRHNGVADSPNIVTGLFQFSDAVGGTRLSNNFGSAPFCLAFTVGEVSSNC